MIQYKTEEEIEIIRFSADILGRVHGVISENIKPGVTTNKLNNLAEEFIKDNKGVPSFLGYKGFPYVLCVSLNDKVVHGFPDEKELEDGDILSVDCGVKWNGFHSDSAYTYAVGKMKENEEKLLKITHDSLYVGIEKAKYGSRIGDIAFSIQQYVERAGFSVIRELVGHGLGRKLHENPEVPNYGKPGKGVKLKEGLVIAIEPMVNMGEKEIYQESDGWTIRTKDGKPSAHYEHTIAIFKNRTEILTTHKYIKEEFKF